MQGDLRPNLVVGLFWEQAGSSGKTVGDLERTVGLMKKVVERVQRENEALKRASGTANQDKLAALQQQHETLKVSTTLLPRVAFDVSHVCATYLHMTASIIIIIIIIIIIFFFLLFSMKDGL